MEARQVLAREHLSEEALRGPNQETINRLTADLPICNAARPVPSNNCPTDVRAITSKTFYQVKVKNQKFKVKALSIFKNRISIDFLKSKKNFDFPKSKFFSIFKNKKSVKFKVKDLSIFKNRKSIDFLK